jgi:hypothetical protein
MKIIKRIDNIAFEWSEYNQKYQIIQYYPNKNYMAAISPKKSFAKKLWNRRKDEK